MEDKVSDGPIKSRHFRSLGNRTGHAGNAERWRQDLSGGQGGIHPCGIGRTMDLKAE